MFTTVAFRAGRAVGATEILGNYGGTLLVVLSGLVTQLGDVWFLFALGSVLYVGGESVPRLGVDRRRALFVFSLALTYVALVGVLKGLFMLPRPPGAGEAPALEAVPPALAGAFESATTAEGPGFPSGHALGTTMVWGGLALVLDRATARARFGVAGAVVAVVSLSRLVLGVHYLVDVVAGAAVGAVALTALYLLADRGTDPGRVLLVAVAVGVAGLFVTVSFDSVAAVGGAVGGWVAWRGVADRVPVRSTDGRAAVAGVAVLAVAGALVGFTYAVEPAHLWTFLGTGLAVASAVAAPLLGERLT